MEPTYQAKGETWPQILTYNYRKYGDNRRAMRHKHYGIWQSHTWKDYYLNVKYLALGLLSFGFAPEDRLLIVGDNAPQWYYAELAAQANHGVAVGLFSELLPSEIKYIAENAGARFAVVEGQEQIDKFLQLKDALPQMKKIVFWNYKGLAHYEDDLLIGYREALDRGQKYEAANPSRFEHNVEAGRPDDICAVIFTAGTTGEYPKGVLHTYRSLRSGAEYLLQLDPWTQNDNVVPHLPPVWITEQWIGIGCHLLAAAILNFAETPETQARDSRETGPSIVFYGARLWESQAAMVQARMLQADVVKRYVYQRFMPIGEKVAELKYRRRKPGFWLSLLYAVADVVVFRPVKRSLGLSNARVCYTTGSVLSPDAFRFYHALDLPLKSVYGSTEGGALTGAKNDDIKPETVGPPHRGVEIRTDSNGELICRQPGLFAGYLGQPEKTDAVLKAGWFHSGDKGYMRPDGHIVVEDRLRDLVKMLSGDTLAPQNVESRLRFSPYIKDAWVLAGPRGAFVSAIVIIDYDAVGRWAGQKRVAFTSFAELSQVPEVYELVKQAIDRVNQALPAGLKVKKFGNLHRELDPDEGEVTRTRKLRRTFLETRYRGIIESIYNGGREAPLKNPGGHRDGATETPKTMIHIEEVG